MPSCAAARGLSRTSIIAGSKRAPSRSISGFGQRVEVGKDGGPRTGLAERGDASIERAFQQQREERAEDVAADRLVELVIDGAVANKCLAVLKAASTVHSCL